MATAAAAMIGGLREHGGERPSLPYRSVDARLAAVDYAPLVVTRSGGDATGDAAELVRLEAISEKARTAENLHRLGSAYLAAGREQARAVLEEALALDPQNAGIESDLAALEMAAGRYADAAERSARLLRPDPGLQSAAFNWALSLQRLGIRPAAVDAWERYLELDPSSAWTVEARKHLSELLRPLPSWPAERKRLNATTDAVVMRAIAERFPQRIRSWLQNELLPRWIETRQPEDEVRLRIIAEARRGNDPFLHDLVEHAGSHPSSLETPLKQWRRAVELEKAEEKDHDAIAIAYAEAAVLLERAGSPLALIADAFAASNEFYAGRSESALTRINAVEERARPTSYHAVRCESAWVRGVVLNRAGRWNDSLQAYRNALEAAREAGEAEHVASLLMLMVGTLDRIGDTHEAERFRAAAFRRFDDVGVPEHRYYTASAEATWTALRAGRPHLALAYIAWQREIANRADDPLLLAETFVKQALAWRAIGERGRAANAITTARNHAARVRTPGMRARVTADVHYVSASVAQDGATAIRELTNALEIWQAYGWSTHSAGTRLLRGEEYRKLGDRQSAEADFRAGLDEMERERSALDEPPFRVAFFERSDRLFERLLELLIEQDRTAEALSVAERKRARMLLEQIAAEKGSGDPLDANAIAAAMPPATALIEYLVLDHSTNIWVVRRNDIAFTRVAAGRDAIAAHVRSYRAAIASSNPDAMRAESGWLVEHLLTPVTAQLAGAETVVLVPDADLQTLPFATLRLPDGRHWVEHVPTAVAPSASVLLQKRSPRSSTQSIAVAAEPSPEGFPALPHSLTEARQVASLYTRGRLFVGNETTPETFLDAARQTTTVHFSGHASLDRAHPSDSALVFDSAEGKPALLTNRMIAASRLPNEPVVVLAACSTASGKIRRNEGLDALAAGFLAAGARSVVATLWDVDDSSSSVFFQALHRNLRDGATPSAALRQAQLTMLQSTNPKHRDPAAWGGVVVFGEP